MTKIYKVTVEKSQYSTGVIAVQASSPEEAEAKVKRFIDSGQLTKSDVIWDNPVDDDSFHTTGDVD